MDPIRNPSVLQAGWLSRVDEPEVYRPQSLVPAPAPEPRIVGYQPYGGGMVPIYERQAPPVATPQRDLTSQPVDPIAQRLVAGGVFAAGVGVGGWLLLSAIAGAALSIGLLVVALAIAKFAPGRRGGDTHIHQHSGLFGRNHIN